jgi:single-stranded-DNA-specific exonuclease
VALQKKLREQGFFETTPEPDLRNFLDLVALGTVCDVMPLLNLNRVFVSHGLRLIERRYNLGMRSIMDVAGCHQKPSSYHLGFVIGPRINAGGRVGKAWLGSELLTTKDDVVSKDYAKQLDLFNQERQMLEKQILTEAEEEINSKNLHKKPLILVSGKKWHPGVIGIVASRIKERYSKPALVVSFLQGIGKGSGRSVLGASLGHAMHQALHHGLLVHGGGHAMAAGFSVEEEKYNAFYSFLCDHFEPFLKDYQPALHVDGIVHLSGVTLDLLKTLERLEPFGQGNPTPRFMIKDVSIVAVEGFGQDHIRCFLISPNGTRIKGVAFRAKGTLLGDVLFSNKKNIHCIGTLKINTWGGNEEINIMIDDIAF